MSADLLRRATETLRDNPSTALVLGPEGVAALADLMDLASVVQGFAELDGKPDGAPPGFATIARLIVGERP